MERPTVGLKAYLSNVILCPLTFAPSMTSRSHTGGGPQSQVVRSPKARRWDFVEVLESHFGMSCQVDRYFRAVTDVQVLQCELLLPATSIKTCYYLEHHVGDPCRLGAEVQVVLDTATLIARSLGNPVTGLDGLMFGTCHAKGLLVRHFSRWFDIRAISWNGPQGPEAYTMAVICVAPGLLSPTDFTSFASARVKRHPRLTIRSPQFDAGLFDSGKKREWTTYETVWAVTRAVCAELYCDYFAVTTYEQWVFGQFEKSNPGPSGPSLWGSLTELPSSSSAMFRSPSEYALRPPNSDTGPLSASTASPSRARGRSPSKRGVQQSKEPEACHACISPVFKATDGSRLMRMLVYWAQLSRGQTEAVNTKVRHPNMVGCGAMCALGLLADPVLLVTSAPS
ncbi:hypothetical protein GLOTRDRAFT_96250 [Gloeophyllum trabeum ATCC 11539]|uniref:Uncharacterized protein n=1 Tax=Gloeophyllum trabeum (strain ATCC 11539 / FP-39264 / Madison 617) TaxID=670483 RepID=S7PVH7_GLOTA|nr:uncharacterized protein GLOTRDRAFT_96250 [Gloeophyllum trabeum ATCC 11539]EPQ51493.1 hypothetical protein GLOTRDRAFT_96250 [Gloeophyllum trabeum ATCC 11539]